MPEVGNMPLPPKLLARGITDVVRISDGRMSGTAYGTVVLHVSPESAAGGALALVQNGDEIALDIDSRRLELCVADEELNRRRAAWVPPQPRSAGGYQRIYIDHVLQSHLGADLDFLVGCRGAGIPRECH
jgi:dihydroxy-acid dehydratase